MSGVLPDVGLADDVVPRGDRELTGDDRGASAVAFLEDLEQIVSGLSIERLKTPVVKDQELDAAKCSLKPGVAPIASRKGKAGE